VDRASAEVATLSSRNWEEAAVKSALPLAAVFWAEWCVPCRWLTSTVEAAARDYSGRVRLGRLNVDDDPDLATRYNIQGLPTLLLLKGGEVKERRVGLIDRDNLYRLLNRHCERPVMASSRALSTG